MPYPNWPIYFILLPVLRSSWHFDRETDDCLLCFPLEERLRDLSQLQVKAMLSEPAVNSLHWEQMRPGQVKPPHFKPD